MNLTGIYRRKAGPFSVQYNPRRSRVEPTTSIPDSLPFDPDKPNFTKIPDDQFIAEERILGERVTYIVNNKPYFEGQHVWVPNVKDNLPQLIDKEEWVELPLTIIQKSGRANIKGFYNSLGAGGSVNHLHFHGFYYGGDGQRSDLWEGGLTAVEKSGREEFMESNGVHISRIVGFPVHGLSFSGGSLQAQTAGIFRYLNVLRLRRLPYQILFTKTETIVMPRHDATRAGFKDGIVNLTGEVLAYNQKFFDESYRAANL